jgi:hypothetical protein
MFLQDEASSASGSWSERGTQRFIRQVDKGVQVHITYLHNMDVLCDFVAKYLHLFMLIAVKPHSSYAEILNHLLDLLRLAARRGTQSNYSKCCTTCGVYASQSIDNGRIPDSSMTFINNKAHHFVRWAQALAHIIIQHL